MTVILLLGSGPTVVQCRDWPRPPFDGIVAINNAWQVRPDWDVHIHPFDFPSDRMPEPSAHQRIVTQEAFVPAQNAFGGFVYGGGTMAFTASYWVLHTLRPKVIAVLGCDMHYPAGTATHFYGAGTPDPLRPDVTLQSLEAKSARLMIVAAQQGCAIVNLSGGPSRLVFPRASPQTASQARPLPFDAAAATTAAQAEQTLGYYVPSGRYWEAAAEFDAAALRAIDAQWHTAALEPAPSRA